jgi:hypothetical protein
MASLAFISASKLVELLKSSDPERNMFVSVISTNRLALGTDPLQPSSVIDLSREMISEFAAYPSEQSISSPPKEELNSNFSKVTRRSGDYSFEIKGKKTECGSLKELLAEGLIALEKAKPGTLENLTRIRGRSRRIVARDASLLYDKPHLVSDYAERLMNGWFYGTNNSARETNVWLQRAVECAGFKWGSDFSTNLGTIPKIEDL